MRLSLEEWRFLAEPFYDVVPYAPEAQAGITIEAYEGAGVLVNKLSCPPQLLLHDPAKRKYVCHDYLLFERFYSGGGDAQVDNIDFTVHPSRLHLIDMSRHYVSVKEESTCEGVLIPHSAVGYDPSVDPAFVSIDLASNGGKLLASSHQMMVPYIREGQPDSADFVGAFLDLVQRFMLRRAPTEQQDHDDLGRPMRTLLREFVKVHLPDPKLSIGMLAENFGVSRATLFRHFEEFGGVQSYIRNCRLDRCLFELAGKPPERGIVSTVAKRWSFNDPTHFNRLFRDRFGMAPSDCFVNDLSTAVPLPTAVTSVAHGWLDSIGP
ncbi:MAG: helix-turn-helix domain-containing protein [Pseudomonadota bacterium]